MFERFTERARQVIVSAQDEALALQHNYIGTEHILLGLLRENEGIAARVLGSLDVTLDEVRTQVERIVGRGETDAATDRIPFTPRAKKALELASREALRIGHSHIGTEHVLLGLARVNGGVAEQILLDLGADAERIRSEVVRTLSGPWGSPAAFELGTAAFSVPQDPFPLGANDGRRSPVLPLVLVGVAAAGVGLFLGRQIWG